MALVIADGGGALPHSVAQEARPPVFAPPNYGPVPGIAPPQAAPTRVPQPAPAPQPGWQGRPAEATAPPADDLTPEERVHVAVYEMANRAVVNISTRSARSEGFFWFHTPAEGEGSGIVLDRAGHVLTNLHVVDGADQIQVNLYDGETYTAAFVGSDHLSDVAVLKIDAPPESLFPVTLGDSTRLRVGQRVYAIGNPFGLERTLTTGIISSLDRALPNPRTQLMMRQMIQIDAAINPGNSGGPLLDSHGRMIGMNTAIASKTGENTGVGFAMPASMISRVVAQLITTGRVVRPNIGIIKVYETDAGLLIAALEPGGPAERAGLQGPRIEVKRKRQGPFVYEQQQLDRSAADLIVAVDSRRVRTGVQFLDAIEERRPGEQVVLTIVREGRELNVAVPLGSNE